MLCDSKLATRSLRPHSWYGLMWGARWRRADPVLVKRLDSSGLLPTGVFGRGFGPMTGDTGGVAGCLQVWLGRDGWAVRIRGFAIAFAAALV